MMHSGVPEEIIYPRFVTATDFNLRELDSVALTDDSGSNKWCEHPVHGSYVDIGVVEVPTTNRKGSLISVNYTFTGGQYAHTPFYPVASLLSIVGFPIRTRPTGFFPIWIQATVASEMEVGYTPTIKSDMGLISPCTLSAFFVDALTSEGMSGSPVFKHESNDDWTFVGIYSGRYKEDDVTLPLGLVWNRELICETILRLVYPQQFAGS